MPRLRFAFTFACVLSLLATTASAQQPPSAPPDPATLRTIEAQVAQIRGLQPLAEPALSVLDRASLATYLKDEFNANYLPSERESDQKEMVALGFLKPTDDIVQVELNLLGDQVIGVYDTDTKSLFVVSDEGAFGPAARVTFAHEFNHALQDQHFALDSLAPKHSDNNDRSLAVHALIEGDAIMLQTLWAQQNLTEAELLDLLNTTGSDAGLAEAPMLVRSELLFPYTDGFTFVRQAFRQAGNAYSGVDAIFANPPESTAQVLHPDKYRDHVHPVDVTLPDIAAALGSDWRKVGSSVLGELDMRVLLEQWGTPSVTATRAAGGWSGDRWQLVEDHQGHSAIAVRSTWESAAAASDFYAAYTRGLRTRFTDAAVDEASTTREALSTADHATDVRLQGTNDVLIVIASDRSTADAVVGAATPSSL